MSQICRYYLKGVCKYGSRCHFLHENVESIYKENYSGYSNTGYHDKYYSNASSFYNKNTSNYNRYHVDRRPRTPTVAKSTSILSDDEKFDVIQQELKEFEERHNWFLTVIAPLKDLGNIPGLKDLSPEELRYQYYESCLNNSLQRFEQNLNIARNDVAQICQIFKTKSRDAYEVVKNMIQKQNTGEMAAGSAATSTFKFDLNALSKPPVQPSGQQFSKLSVEISPINGSMFPSGDFSVAPINNFSANQSSVPNFESNFTNNFNQQTSAINSFSFSLNKLQPSQNDISVPHNSGPSSTSSVFGNSSSATNSSIFGNPNCNVNPSPFDKPIPTSSVNVFGNPVSISTTENSVYSKSDEIPRDALSAFQAKFFQIGDIPLVAPSKELCYN